jgi:hypothetical protein
MYPKLLSVIIATLFTNNIVNAQQVNVNDSEQTAVKMVIQNLFNAMKSSDTVLLKTCFSPTAVFQTIVSKDKVVVVKDETVQNFINSIGTQPAGSLDERIVFETVKTNMDLAVVWTPYEFYFKDKYSHKGVNSFQLVKFKEGWKIQYLIDTRYK